MTVKKRKHTPAIRIGLILFGIGLSLLMTSAMGFLGGHQAKSWTPSPGVVQTSKLQGSSTGQSGNNPTYTALISYRYQFKGKNYLSERVYFLDIPGWTYQHAADILNRFPEKAEVDILVNPDNPENSVLISGAPPNVYLILGLGIVLVGIGGLSVRSELKKKQDIT